MNWVWGQRLACSPKLVLMALADAADDTGYCWPKIKTVARKCCVSERTVQRVMKNLIAAGLLESSYRYSEEGRQLSNGYRLMLDNQGPDKLSPAPRGIDAGVTPQAPPGVTKTRRGRGDRAMSYQQPPQEPKNQTLSGFQAIAPPHSLRFPFGLGDLEQRRCAALVAELDEAQAQGLLDGLARTMVRGMIRTTPEQWLWGAVQARLNGRRAHGKTLVLSEHAYRDELMRKGLSAEDAADIAAKTCR
ncbi:helix-turn-helix domain-containing protein [Stutzerimonas kunmingensis]|uniref:helix-turn-helix domain-containing protein n=1 Tax=Stutzerimonas kunmingensis TaxID=1211807 RepID=UPI0039C94576